jgi:hypothetical protein
MLNEKQIKEKISIAHEHMEEARNIFGKEIFQKRMKPSYEGYLTALCTILEHDEDKRTGIIRDIKDGDKEKK